VGSAETERVLSTTATATAFSDFLMANANTATVFTPTNCYSFRRSAYGQKNVTTSVSILKNCFYLNVEDTELQRRSLTKDQANLKEQIAEMDRNIALARDTKIKLGQKYEQANKSRAELNNTLKAINNLKTSVELKKNKIARLEDEANTSESGSTHFTPTVITYFPFYSFITPIL
jgi:hypothetical protein